MRQNKRIFKLLATLFITLFLFMTIIKVSSEVNKTHKAQPTVINGIVDLRNWEFKKDGMVKLDGQWEFYRDQLLTPEDFTLNKQRNMNLLPVPGEFAKYGYGTYRIKLLVGNTKDMYGIKIEFLQSAYKLWANKREIVSVGQVGSSVDSMTPQLLPKQASFQSDTGEIYLTLQVSNFYAKSGMIDTITLGSEEQIDSSGRKKLAFDMFLFGSTLLAAIYNIGMYLKRKKDKAPLYFSIVCSTVAVRTLFLGERFFISVFPGFSYQLSGKVMHWTFYLYMPFIVLFMNSFYEGILSKKIVYLSTVSAYIYALSILISPWKYYMDIIFPFELLSVALLIYLIYKISYSYIRGRESYLLPAVGLFSLLITRLNDILYEYSIIITGSFAPLGSLIFIVANSYLLAERQSHAFSNEEEVSDKLKSLDKLKDDFLAITSHELKTPLNGIIGLSERISNLDEEDLSLINTSAKRLTYLVDDIMIFSKLKNNDIKLVRRAVDIKRVSDTVVKFCSTYINNKEIDVKNLIDKNAPLVYGDEGRIHQILYNLIGNAIKFTQKGSVTLSYRKQGDFIEISVQDTGIGISNHSLSRIFGLYEQAEGVSENYGGTGLGLYITQKLVELHGGSINAESTLNGGSRFSFSLPICKDTTEAIKQDNHAITKLEASDNYVNLRESVNIDEINSTNKVKILIVDDEYVNQRVLENFFINENFLIIKAYSGKEAIKCIEQTSDLDLVILDMMMPDLLGFEVTKIIREKYSMYELPILIMTAENRLSNMMRSFESGANDFLPKPFNKHELIARVNTLVTLKHSVGHALNLAREITEANQQVNNLRAENEVTSRKVFEMIEYDKVKTEFFTNLSHELRTPLNVICSTIQLLGSIDQSKQLSDERIRYYLSIMNQNSLRLLRLINNLIDITKLDGGYLNLTLKNLDIVYVVEEIAQSVAEYIKSQNITITFDTDTEEKLMAIDEEKLERILLNILSNSVKFTDKGGSISINLYDYIDFVEISIEDTGIGIPKDKQDYIFERFAQVDKSLRRKAEGSGIGLSLVKSLVEMHDGEVNVISEPGKGSKFTLKFPVKLIDEEKEEVGLYSKEAEDSKIEKKLLVEFSDIYM